MTRYTLTIRRDGEPFYSLVVPSGPLWICALIAAIPLVQTLVGIAPGWPWWIGYAGLTGGILAMTAVAGVVYLTRARR